MDSGAQKCLGAGLPGWLASGGSRAPEGHGHGGEDEDDGGREDGAAGAVDEGLLVASQIVGLGMARHLVGLTPHATVSRAEFIAALAPVFDHYLTGHLNPA